MSVSLCHAASLKSIKLKVWQVLFFPGGSDKGAEGVWCNVGDTGSIPGWGRSPGKGNGSLLQYSGLENPKDRRAWQATVRGITKSWTRLSNWTQSTARLLTNLAEFRQFINYFMLDFIVFHLWWDYNSYRSLLCTLSAVLNTHTHTHTHTHLQYS